ncbi:MAG: DUF4397 domain-containing protein [Gemmatimonadaceae bacterium]|nr:DUF4397 domain-containing protein [Gemmatimonadaceae bacterium]
MRNSSLQFYRALSALALLAMVAACNDSDGPERVARVRFLHAAQGLAAIDFRADGATRRAAVGYSVSWSADAVLSAGTRSFTARLTGGTTDLATTAKALANSASYSIALAKRPTTDTLVVYSDTAATPATDKAWVRLLNVSPAAGSIDVYITAAGADLATATPQATNLTFLSASPYLEVASGAQRVRLTTTGTKTVVLDINTIALTSRGVRSIALLDSNTGGTPLQGVTSVEKN